jgi:hypothetical protein
VDPEKVHDLHMLISSISRPEQLDLSERDIATQVDFSYAGPQSLRVAQLLADGKLRVGAIHTYLELYARLFVDLVPTVALVTPRVAGLQITMRGLKRSTSRSSSCGPTSTTSMRGLSTLRAPAMA